MKTMWKYTLEVKIGPQPLQIPYSSDVLLGPHVDFQNGHLTLWVEVDTEAEAKEYVFHVFGTGWEIPPGLDRIGTATLDGYVWHVFVDE